MNATKVIVVLAPERSCYRVIVVNIAIKSIHVVLGYGMIIVVEGSIHVGRFVIVYWDVKSINVTMFVIQEIVRFVQDYLYQKR